jgi:hypothetical protein
VFDTGKDRLDGVYLIRAVLENLHDSLKWLWLIIMGLSLVNAVEVYARLLEPRNVENVSGLVNMFFVEHTIVFISFILVFIRFYFGDSRFLDLSYKETQYSRGLKAELDKYGGRKRALDIMLLLNHGIFFYFMSFYIGNPAYYSYFFVILMIVNVFWLLLQVIAGINAKYPEPDPLIGNMKGQRVLLTWIVNNLLFVIIISNVIFSELSQRMLICIALTIANSIADLCFTWKYYFPPLRELCERGYSEKNSSSAPLSKAE